MLEKNSTKALLSTRPGQVLLLTMAGATMLFALWPSAPPPGGLSRGTGFFFAHLYTGQSPWSWGRTPGQKSGLLNAMLPFIQPFSDAGAVLALIAFVIALLLLLGLKRAAVFFVFAVMIGGLAPLLKQAFSRPSPFPLPNDPSFPSGHAIVSMAFVAGVVAFLPPGRWRLLVLLVGGIFVVADGAAVVTDGGHWPSRRHCRLVHCVRVGGRTSGSSAVIR